MKADTSAVDPALVAARADALALYSPYSFLREVSVPAQQERFGTGRAARFGSAEEEVLPMTQGVGQWLIARLPWDSAYFATPTYRLLTGLFDGETSFHALKASARALRQHLGARGSFYAFGIVPAEDTILLQALTAGGWHLVETRLTFYRSITKSLLIPRYSVRLAQVDDAERVAQIAAAARNPYDRYHADPWFGNARADAFLARYAEASVRGTCADAVLLPNEAGLPVDGFLAIDDLRADSAALGIALSRVLLTAVGAANRGWHEKLVAETLHRAAALGHTQVLMTTQATNRAVFRTCEKLEFRLGATSHVMACHGG